MSKRIVKAIFVVAIMACFLAWLYWFLMPPKDEKSPISRQQTAMSYETMMERVNDKNT